ncbi:MAG: hypothetical protein ACTIJ6_05445 [Leucobacter sp.]
MKKVFTKTMIAAVAAAGLVFSGATVANAAEECEVCVPRTAWTEVVEHPAVEAVTEVVHHEAVPQEIAAQYKWSRKIFTQLAQPSIPGTGSHYELESQWRAEGDSPSGDGWSICNQRILKDADGTITGKEYQWHQLIPGTPYVPAVKAKFYFQNTDYLAEGVSPSDEWPADAVDAAEWRRGGVSNIITKPYEKAWDEIVVITEGTDAWTETIEHTAVECEVLPETSTPETELEAPTTTPAPVAKSAAVKSPSAPVAPIAIETAA